VNPCGIRTLLFALVALTLATGLARAELVGNGDLRVEANAELRPKHLPRHGRGPISVSVTGLITTTDGDVPPQLERTRIELNRHARLESVGLPRCTVPQIQPASTAAALMACRPALVGQGSFSVDVVLGGQEPYPTTGRLLLFNARYKGRPAILGHIYSARPFANSFVIPFRIDERKHGEFGLALSAKFPPAFTSWGHVTGLSLRLNRRYRHRGERRSFLSAGCPAPDGFSRAIFSLARTSFTFADGKTLRQTLSGTCAARGGGRGA
jgi:hypothetical protein